MNHEADNETADFGWSDDDSIVVKPTEGIAVYTNTNRDIVVRQQNSLDIWDKDPYIIIPRDRVADVISALQKEIEE